MENPLENTIVISNLTLNVAEGHLKEIFGNYGAITNIKLARNSFGQSLKWAFMTFENAEMMNNAIHYMNGGQIDGLVISVRIADPNVDHL